MALLRSEEYIDERGYTIREEYYGKYDDNGNEVITATIKEELPPMQENNVEHVQNVTEAEVQATILLNQAEIIAKQKTQDEILAKILLNQTEV